MILLEVLTKYFFLFIVSIYCYRKILNIDKFFLDIPQISIFTILSIIIVLYFKKRFPFLIPFLLTVLVFASCKILYKNNLKITMELSIFSVAISYFLFALAPIFLLPFSGMMYLIFNKNNIMYVILQVLTGIFQLIVIISFFHLKRFQNGLPDIEKYLSSDIGIFTSIVILLIEPLFFFSENNLQLTVLLVLFISLFGSIIILWIYRHISARYLAKAYIKTIDRLEATIHGQQCELDKLSKLIHKDNKLLAALELSVREMLSEHTSEKGRLLLNAITELSKERKYILGDYENSGLPATSRTGVYAIDLTLNYFFQRACTEEARLDISVACDVGYLTAEIIEERDLNTLLADLLENALIAVAKAQQRNILLVFGVSDVYYFSIYDSGSLFDPKVLEHLGRKRYTTRKENGGSGIGLMTTLELTKKYQASFWIKELDDNRAYSKQVSVIFDALSQIRVSSQRPEILDACKKNGLTAEP